MNEDNKIGAKNASPVTIKLSQKPEINSGVNKKIKVLWYSDFLRHTGFGNVAEEILSRLQKTGRYDFVVLGINYHGVPYCASKSEYYHLKDIPVYPAFSGGPSASLFGYDILSKMLATQKFDIFFALQDSFNLLPVANAIKDAKKNRDFRYIYYFPIDGDIKQLWVDNAIDLADYPVTYTEYGKNKVLEKNARIAPKVIPHGIDLDMFKPFKSLAERGEFRKRYFNAESDLFLISNINRNQPRKDLPRTILAFREFCKRYKNINSKLYLHCYSRDNAGHKLHEFVTNYLPEELWERVIMPSDSLMEGNGVSIATLSKVYASSDIVTSTSYGEGWGLCLHPESMVKTNVGYREINSIKEGDKVLTRNGYKEVVGTSNREHIGELISITVKKRAVSLALKLTPEHRILTKEGWKEAGKLTMEDTLYIAKDYFVDYERHIFDLANYCNEYDYCKTENNIWIYGSKKKDYKRFMLLNKNFAELYGIYLAEGSASSNGIVFSISQEEDWLMQRITDLVKDVWGLDVAVENDKHSKKRWIRVYGNILEEFYRKIAGRGARNKNISILHMLTKHTAGKVLLGFWYGDGSTEPSGYEMTTCSKQLVHDLSQLGDKLGMRLSIEHNTKRDSYRLRTGKEHAYKLSMIGGNQKFEKYGFNPIEDTIEVSIKKLETIKYTGLVHDISIEGVHEFQTNQCIVHNSTTEAMACKVPVVMPNNSATTEIIGKNNERGYLVKCGETLNDYDVHKFDNELMRPLTDIEDLISKWKYVYDNPEEAKEKAENAHRWLQNYTWDRIADQWDQLFQEAYNR